MTTHKPIQKRADYALELLHELLNRTEVGERLSPERELAQQFGVSRRVLREALDQLEQEGRIARAPGRGTVVTAPSQSELIDNKVLGLTDISTPLEVVFGSSPLDLIDARFVLEPAIAAAAAMHASIYDINEMYELLERGRQSTNHKEWEQWDSALHQRIGDATHNGFLQHFYKVLNLARAQTEWGRLRQLSLSVKNQKIYSDQHLAIVDAIQARNPTMAASCMRAHLTVVKRTLIDGLDASEN